MKKGFKSFKKIDLTRRNFLKSAATGAAISMTIPSIAIDGNKDNTKVRMPKRRLGKTNEMVSMITVGGLHTTWKEKEPKIVEQIEEEESIKIIRGAIDNGVNFLDNAWSYNEGRSEEVMGRALKDGYRKKVMVMTKVNARDLDGAKVRFETSLKRFQLDSIDLMQFHAIGVWEGDVDAIYNNGLLDWAMELRAQGVIKYIGFTGHNDPKVHLDMIQRGFDWDTVQMPINVVDYHKKESSFERDVLPEAIKRDIGVIAMKTNGYGRPWYASVTNPLDGLRYAMSLPVATVASGMTSEAIMKENIGFTSNFEPFSKEEMEAHRSSLQQKSILVEEHYKRDPIPKKK